MESEVDAQSKYVSEETNVRNARYTVKRKIRKV